MIKLNYSSISSLARLCDKAASTWMNALNVGRCRVDLLATSVNVANVIINFGRVDRSTSPTRIAQHEIRDGIHHITLASDIKWQISAWQRFMGIGQENAYAALLHEFGHALGFPHSNEFSDVMNAECGSTVISADEAEGYRIFFDQASHPLTLRPDSKA